MHECSFFIFKKIAKDETLKVKCYTGRNVINALSEIVDLITLNFLCWCDLRGLVGQIYPQAHTSLRSAKIAIIDGPGGALALLEAGLYCKIKPTGINNKKRGLCTVVCPSPVYVDRFGNCLY